VLSADRIAVVADEPLDIVAETPEWVAANKPPGMPAQPPRDRQVRSLEELLRVRYRTIYLVHRIDTPASGLVLFARTPAMAAKLSELFATGAIRKLYLAAIDGNLAAEQTIDTPIEGRDALTIVRPHGDGLVEAEIKTGRTHQIRIHLASIGHPIRGDRRYGGLPAPRLMLHAWKLQHPLVGALEAPIPPDFSR
jgi:23S rRNA-/tRNA-specific pseudouridylate synthase